LTTAATLVVDGQPVLVAVAHPNSPTSMARMVERDSQIGLLATPVSALQNWYHVVLVGDFNATTSCRSIRSLLATTEFRDTRQGFGVQDSWPTWFWPLAICIDQGFVSGGVHVHDRRTGPNVGSDHLPVILELSFDEHLVIAQRREKAAR
jgi:endonuclease/exonuclease/phosphatase family metal-dependent hydrolase